MIDHGFEPRLDQTKKHSVIDHGFEPRLSQTKKHSVIDHGFKPSNRYTHLFLIEREYFGFNTLGSVIVE